MAGKEKSEMGKRGSISTLPGDDDLSMIIWIVVTVIMVLIAICRCVDSRNERKRQKEQEKRQRQQIHQLLSDTGNPA